MESLNEVTDIWFRSMLPLSVIAEKLGLANVTLDAENDWEWAIGTLEGVELDVTRLHSFSRWKVDVRIFRVDQQPLDVNLREKLVELLWAMGKGPVCWGRLVNLRGNEFAKQLVGSTPRR